MLGTLRKKTTDSNANVQIRNEGRKERPAKKIYNVSAGGGIQLLIPRKAALTGGDQLNLKDIVKIYPLKNDLSTSGGYVSTNIEKKPVETTVRKKQKSH